LFQQQPLATAEAPVLLSVFMLGCGWLYFCSASSSVLDIECSVALLWPPLFKTLKSSVDGGVRGKMAPVLGAQDMFDPLWLKIFGSCLGIAG
jgi:hypothetical protein